MVYIIRRNAVLLTLGIRFLVDMLHRFHMCYCTVCMCSDPSFMQHKGAIFNYVGVGGSFYFLYSVRYMYFSFLFYYWKLSHTLCQFSKLDFLWHFPLSIHKLWILSHPFFTFSTRTIQGIIEKNTSQIISRNLTIMYLWSSRQVLDLILK